MTQPEITEVIISSINHLYGHDKKPSPQFLDNLKKVIEEEVNDEQKVKDFYPLYCENLYRMGLTEFDETAFEEAMKKGLNPFIAIMEIVRFEILDDQRRRALSSASIVSSTSADSLSSNNVTDNTDTSTSRSTLETITEIRSPDDALLDPPHPLDVSTNDLNVSQTREAPIDDEEQERECHRPRSSTTQGSHRPQAFVNLDQNERQSAGSLNRNSSVSEHRDENISPSISENTPSPKFNSLSSLTENQVQIERL